MKSLKLNDNGDLNFNDINSLEMVEGENEVRQRIRLGMGTYLGEWFLDTSLGMDWFELLQKENGRDEIKRAVLEYLNEDAAIDKVNEIELDFDIEKRHLDVKIDGTLTDESNFRMTVGVV